METSAGHGEVGASVGFPIDRRSLIGGLTAWAALPMAPRTQSPIDPVDAPISEADLLVNLLTRMATRVELNGQRGFVFVIDTGAARTALAEDVAEALSLPPGPSVLVHGVTSAEVAPTVRLDRLGVGPRRLSDLTTPVFPRRVLGADGLLGLDVLSRFELAFDLSRLTVSMTPSGADVATISRSYKTPSRLMRTVPARVRAGQFGQLILLDTEIEGVPVEAFVDSGAQYSIANLALRRALGGDRDRQAGDGHVMVHGVIGQTALARPGEAREIELAGQRLGTTPLLFADLHAFRLLDMIDRPALLIGADILYRFRRVTLDFGRSRMVFSGLKRPIARG